MTLISLFKAPGRNCRKFVLSSMVSNRFVYIGVKYIHILIHAQNWVLTDILDSIGKG